METPVPGQVGRLRDRRKYSENLNHAPEKVMEFHTKNLGASCRIHALAFGSIPFRPISLFCIELMLI